MRMSHDDITVIPISPNFKKWAELVQPTLLKSIRFCFIDVRWLLTAFDFQILKTTTCTLSYKTLKILSTFCSLVWRIKEILKILFSKIWPDGTDSCNIMCIWVKSPGEFKNLDLSKVNEHRTSSSLLESLKLSCTCFYFFYVHVSLSFTYYTPWHTSAYDQS